MEVPHGGSLVIQDPSKLPDGDIRYIGRGLDQGECYILIKNVKEAYDGDFRCSVLTKDNSYESSAVTKIVIASKWLIAFKNSMDS